MKLSPSSQFPVPSSQFPVPSSDRLNAIRSPLPQISRRITAWAIVLALGLGAASGALAAPLYSSGSETLSNATSGGFTLGFQFVSTVNQFVTALGFWDQGANGLPGSFRVGLYALTTQALLAEVIISSADALDPSVFVNGGYWRYETLASPVALTSGTSYVLAYYNATNLSGPDSLLLSYPTLGGLNNVTVPAISRYVGGASLAFPTITLDASTVSLYSQANLMIGSVPEPSTLALAVIGLVWAAGRRRAGRG